MKKIFFVFVAAMLISSNAHAGKGYTNDTAPATCVDGDFWIDTNGTSTERFHVCEEGTWVKHLGNGTTSNPSFNSIHATGGNIAASSAQVTKKWITGLSYTADVTSVIHGGKHWIAKTTHTAGSTTEPGVGANYADAWKEDTAAFNEAGDYTPTGEWNFSGATVTGLSGGSMIYPGAGVPNSTGSAWGTSYTVGTAANNLMALNSSGQLPFAIDISDLSDDDGLFTAKANASCFASESAFNACFDLTWATGGATSLSGLSDWPSAVSATEVGYLDGVTSGIQAQINALSVGSGGTVTVVTADPYSDVACTGAKYNSSNDRLFPCLGGYHIGYVGLTDFSNPQPVTRTLTITSPSNGTITCSDADLSASINCGTGGSACTATATDGASITGITATADSGYALSAWSGDLSGSTNPTTLTMSANRGIGATFALAGPTAYDHFTGTDGTLLSSHTSDSGHTWALSGSSTLSINSNKVIASQSGNPGLYYSSAVPTDANYSVSAKVIVGSSGSVSPGVAGRISTSAETGYLAYWNDGSWRLLKTVEGSRSTQATYSGDIPTTEKAVTLSMVSDTIKVLVDGVERISYTDPSPITPAGRPGVGSYYADGVGRTIDDWEFTD